MFSFYLLSDSISSLPILIFYTYGLDDTGTDTDTGTDIDLVLAK